MDKTLKTAVVTIACNLRAIADQTSRESMALESGFRYLKKKNRIDLMPKLKQIINRSDFSNICHIITERI
jgi:hypothetical protein